MTTKQEKDFEKEWPEYVATYCKRYGITNPDHIRSIAGNLWVLVESWLETERQKARREVAEEIKSIADIWPGDKRLNITAEICERIISMTQQPQKE